MIDTSAYFGAFEKAIVGRAALMWLVVRIISAPFLIRLGQDPVFVAPSASLMVAASAAALCWIVTRRRFEIVILGNLGTGPWRVAGVCVAVPLLLELILGRFG